jgi:hypothetical protein
MADLTLPMADLTGLVAPLSLTMADLTLPMADLSGLVVPLFLTLAYLPRHLGLTSLLLFCFKHLL